MGAQAPRANDIGTLTFYYPPFAVLPGVIGLAAMSLHGLYIGTIRMRWNSVGNIVGCIVLVCGLIWACLLFMSVWNVGWRFTFTPTQFISERSFGRHRTVIPWEAIIRVKKKPNAWSIVGFGWIESSCGQSTLISTYILDYEKFIEQLRTRAVNCREFDPYDPKLVDHL